MYRGTVWQLIILASLGADGADPRVRAGCEAILRDAQDPESGGSAVGRATRFTGGLHGSVIPCLTGNLVRSLIRLGLLDDPRVQRAIAWITTYQRFDDGDGDAPTGWPHDRFERWRGRRTCHLGAVKALKALAAIPPQRRSTSSSRNGARRRRPQGGRERSMEARVDVQRPLPRADRGQGRIEPLDHAPGAAGALHRLRSRHVPGKIRASPRSEVQGFDHDRANTVAISQRRHGLPGCPRGR